MKDLRFPPTRSYLLSGVFAFVRSARELPEVLRISLLGSLTTAKPNPKDADLLVTVANDVALDELAKLGRRLQGHAQQVNRGADIFLANPRGTYIGRICHWRECWPRVACDARHCGLRPHLHDDLGTIRLRRELIASPPLDLWPQLVVRAPLPADVQQLLLQPLTSEI